ncbi:S8 family peptidase [Sphingobacterium spiritivorum]|uniref:S8 family peptidase n=1 Tax=Sphingobacterium spiritivorum TaxID=258 RepID=UPI003DA6160C
MKSSHLIILLLLLLIGTKGFAQQVDYYYYQGKKRPIKLHSSLYYICFSDTTQTLSELKRGGLKSIKDSNFFEKNIENHWRIINLNEYKKQRGISRTEVTASLRKNKDILYMAPVIGENETLYTPVSEYFHIELKNDGDLSKLKDIAKTLGAVYVSAVPYSSPWHTFRSEGNINSIDIANKIYESGIAKEIAPDFMFDFRNTNSRTDIQSCITDPQFPQQWGLKQSNGIDIKACNVWSITKGSPNVRIGILDTGVDPTNVEFSNNLSSLSFDAQSGTSPSKVYGSDHGTHVAGIIGANQNGKMISGIAPASELVAISHSMQIMPNVSAQLASGINWAWQNGVHIMNNSWGDQGGALYLQLQSAVLESAINNALNNGRGGLGTILVFAAGNWAPAMDYPATYSPNNLTVGSILSSGKRSDFSGYGSLLDVMAPGENILSTTFGNTTTYKDGTSMAAPHVAGITALMLSVAPDLTRGQVVDIIEKTAQKVGGYSYSNTSGKPNGTWNNQMGYGLVNANAAVLLAAASGGGGQCTPSSAPTFINGITYNANTTLTGCNFRFVNSSVSSNVNLIVNATGYVLLENNFTVNFGGSLTIM